MIRKSIICPIALVVLITCSDEREALLNDQMLAIEGLDADSLYRADPANEISFKVRFLPKRVENQFRKVVLTSEGGEFRPESIIIPDSTNEAEVTFIPGLTTGKFEIKAAIAGKPEIFVIETITLETPLASQVIFITLNPDSTAANGLAVLEGEIMLKLTNERTLKLVTSDPEGVFLPAHKNEVTIEVMHNGTAGFKVKAGTNPGNYFITATLMDSRSLSTETPYELSAPTSADVLDLHLDSDRIKADGNTLVTGTIAITDYPLRNVTLTTTEGNFPGSNNSKELVLEPDASGRMSFSLLASTAIKDHTISAKLGEGPFQVSKTLIADTAYADGLYLQPSSFEIDSASGSVTIDIFLLRDDGKASTGIPLTISATQDQNGNVKQVGIFRTYPLLSGADQKATSTFTLDTRRAISGSPIVVTVTTRDDDNQPVNSSIQLEVVKQ